MTDILKQELEKVKISAEELEYLNYLANKTIEVIGDKIRRAGIDASLFLGGSLAKNTILRKKNYDIDLFVRFNKKYTENEIKKYLKKIVKRLKIAGQRTKIKRVHGSRDYFKVIFKKNKNIYVEVVPSLRITKPEQARNITDLSYFHVNYIKKKFKRSKKLADEILLAKSFCHGQKCYGAESYIRGFSGYALELLVVYYGGFKKFLSEVVKAKEQIILDGAKHYKDKQEILDTLNPTKLKSPIVLVDPTFKNRNAARALSKETFNKFKSAARKFLENPSEEFFVEKKADINVMREKAKEFKGLFAVFEIKTKKQPGDIAGTKLLKFSKFLGREIKKHYDIVLQEFEYGGVKNGWVFFVLSHRGKTIVEGPPIDKTGAVQNFKKKHPIWYLEDGRIKCAITTDITIKEFLKKFKKTYKRTIKQMSIKKVRIV